MKRIYFTIFFLFCVLITNAQKDVTKFLGIPVEGSKSEMRRKLISKGFTPKTVFGEERLEGEFNGTDVYLMIGTNNNKVWRIVIADMHSMDDKGIKNRFNRLVSQFENNERYITPDDFKIPEEENIKYKIYDKTYEAVFYQKPDENKIDTAAIRKKIENKLLSKYSEEEFKNPSEEKKQEIQLAFLQTIQDLFVNKPVWFKIEEKFGEYYIMMFYDNEYNHANGEDL